MEKSFGLFFHLKITRNNNAAELPIYLCITVNKVSREISTKRKCDPSKWNATAGRVEGKTQYAKSSENLIDIQGGAIIILDEKKLEYLMN